jgi:hypothetical protein
VVKGKIGNQDEEAGFANKAAMISREEIYVRTWSDNCRDELKEYQ